MQDPAALAHAVLEVSAMMARAGRTMTDPAVLATRVLVAPPTMVPQVRRIQGLVVRVMEDREAPAIQAQVGRVKTARRFAGDVEWPLFDALSGLAMSFHRFAAKSCNAIMCRRFTNH